MQHLPWHERLLPVLRKHCYECHSHESKIKGGLALDSKSGWQSGGDHDVVNPPAFSFKKTRPIQEFERTIYQPVIRTAAQPGSARLRDVFDFTQPAQIAGKRAETAVPTQSLFPINKRDDATRFLAPLHADKAWIELTHALLASNEFLLRL